MSSKLLKQIALICADVISIQLSFFIAFLLRFESNLFVSADMEIYLQVYLDIFIVITVLKILVMYFMKMYNSLWRYATINEFLQIILSSFLSMLVLIAFLLLTEERLPRSICILTFIFDAILFSTSRLGYRIYIGRFKNISTVKNKLAKRVMIIGAGNAGVNVIRELKASDKLNSVPICLVDDDTEKIGQTINGVPILGTRLAIRELVALYKIDQIIIAIPSASKNELKEIINEATKTDCELKIVPGIYEFIDGKVDVSKIRSVEITDLLGRDEIKLSTNEMKTYISKKVVLVTGAGGSIGSELCRQIANYEPEKLVLLDIYENGVFELENEIKSKFKNINTEIVIASIRDKERIFSIVEKYKPFVIFHAAAHKHVPLMEFSPEEAVKNNIFGSYNIMEAAKEYNVDRFVLISTDKAVNPANVMGTTKRIAELIVQSYKDLETTKFVAVRFGNVLGSNGSVIPIFKNQIEQGGPITITHKDITRYFMTIPEAARLVVQASSFGQNSEIFVLDMGEPVKILDLAENLIRLSGFVPYQDIAIEFTGLRPGEKMYEELLMNDEKCSKTEYEKIFIERQEETKSSDEIKAMLEEFLQTLENKDDIRVILKKYVPTYKYD